MSALVLLAQGSEEIEAVVASITHHCHYHHHHQITIIHYY